VRIAYVYLGASIDRLAGVRKKLVDQGVAWRREGHEPQFFLQVGDRKAGDVPAVGWEDLRVQIFSATPGAPRWMRALTRMQQVRRLVEAVQQWGPNVVYLRYSVHYPALSGLLRNLPVVLEVNTNDLDEYALQLDPIRFLYHRLTRGLLLKSVRGIVFVTGELQRLPAFDRWGKASIVIGNGVALGRFERAPAPAGGRPRLVFVGEPGLPWHGVDKIVELARREPGWEFDIVGLQRGVADHDLCNVPNLSFHGYLTGEEYQAVMRRADVGIGTLALHRNRMNEACSLKVRDYLAIGLPVIIGHADPDLDPDSWFVLRLSNTPDNVVTEAHRIREFVDRVKGRRVGREEVAHLDTTVKERRRLEFIARIAGDRMAGRRPR